MVSRWQGHGVAKCIAVAGELGSWRIAGAIDQAREAHAAGSDSHISSGNFYWRRPRRPPSFRRAGHRSVRSGGRPSCVSGAGCRADEATGTLSGEFAALAAEKDLLLSGCGPRRHFSRERPGVLREGDFQIEQAAVLENGARFVSRPPDASQVLS